MKERKGGSEGEGKEGRKERSQRTHINRQSKDRRVVTRGGVSREMEDACQGVQFLRYKMKKP